MEFSTRTPKADYQDNLNTLQQYKVAVLQSTPTPDPAPSATPTPDPAAPPTPDPAPAPTPDPAPAPTPDPAVPAPAPAHVPADPTPTPAPIPAPAVSSVWTAHATVRGDSAHLGLWANVKFEQVGAGQPVTITVNITGTPTTGKFAMHGKQTNT